MNMIQKMHFMAVRMALLLVAAAVITGLTACQPTPEKPVIVNKNDGKTEQKMTQTAQPSQNYDAPAHWKETVNKDKLTIEIDTDVKLPEIKEYPALKMEPVIFTQECREYPNYAANRLTPLKACLKTPVCAPLWG